jgi:hypothetical protein
MNINPLYKIQIEDIKKKTIMLVDFISIRKEKISNVNNEIMFISNKEMSDIKKLNVSTIEKITKLENKLELISLKTNEINYLFKEIENEVEKINKEKKDLYVKLHSEYKMNEKTFEQLFL